VGSEYSILAGRSGGEVISGSVNPRIASYVVAGVAVVRSKYSDGRSA